MKTSHLIALLMLAGGGWLHAQTNVNAAALPARATNAETHIHSNLGEFDLTARRAVYRGNVRVDDPQLKLTCEQLTAELPQLGGHIDHLVALTNVVMDSVDDKGQTNHATSDMAVYDYHVQNGVTNELITLSGNARAENAQVILYGEPIIYNRGTGSLTATNQHMIFRGNLKSAMVSTNAPAPKTNSPPDNKDLPISKTNFPPGTIQNIDQMTLPQSGTTTH